MSRIRSNTTGLFDKQSDSIYGGFIQTEYATINASSCSSTGTLFAFISLQCKDSTLVSHLLG
ncbi:hypothetical protein BLOT_010962 [Blomia tropicalis]|nr:hypothetical protein BLOT_010962 [Blomia tropicalis]